VGKEAARDKGTIDLPEDMNGNKTREKKNRKTRRAAKD